MIVNKFTYKAQMVPVVVDGRVYNVLANLPVNEKGRPVILPCFMEWCHRQFKPKRYLKIRG